jgi:basic membrane protein A and related proteins
MPFKTNLAVKPYKTAFAGIAAAGLLTLAACGEAPEDDANGDAVEASFKACMVTDSGGVDDKSFNESAWRGMQAADANPDIEILLKESTTETDYDPNILDAIDEGCDVVVGVGGLMTGNIEAAAGENPDTAFVTVDGVSELENVYSVEFDTAQAAFLAGYLAAGTTESGTVGTWGGMKIPPVTIFMDGFVHGVDYYNEQNDADVEVLGWDVASQEGSFTNDFIDTTAGKTITDTLVEQGADIVMPVAGPAGAGAVAAANETDGLSVIWVDADGCDTDPDNCSVFLTTVLKQLGSAVEAAVLDAYAGNTGGTYVGTLENEGVGLAPYHEFEDAVSDDLKAEIDEIRAAIIAGEITVESAASPQ